MKCQGLRDSIPDYLAGELPRDALKEFEAHLMECDDCRAELTHAESTWVALGQLPDEEPSPEIRGRFYAMLEDEKRRLARAERESWLKRVEGWLNSWWPRRPAIQMAMVTVCMVVGLAAGGRLNTGAPDNGEFTQLRDEVQQMHQMVSLSLLGQDSSSDRLRGVNWSTRVAEPSDALLSSLRNTLGSDPNENVRLAAVDALALFRNEAGVVDALTQALTQETSPTVQVALIDLLIAIQEKKSLEALKNFIETKDAIPSVKEHAENRISDFS
jgi:anti-sigma factor RsiW